MSEMTTTIDDHAEVSPYTPAKQGGDRKFSARQAPWMKLGTVIDAPVTSAEAARLAGMDFEIELLAAGFRDGPAPDAEDAPTTGTLSADELSALADEVGKASNAEAMRKFGRRVPELLAHIASLQGGTGRTGSNWIEVLNRKAVVRKDTREPFDYVSGDYVPIQYREAFDFMDSISSHVVSAGTLMGGRQGFMVVQVPNLTSFDLKLGDESDPHDLYGILRTSHNRSRGLEFVIMSLRHRCMNSLGLSSFGNGAPQRWSVRHVGDPKAKLVEARRAVANLEAYAVEYRRMVERLHATDVELEAAEEVLRTVLPDRPRREQQVSSIVQAWRESPMVGPVGAGNAWGLVNGVSEYFEWQRDTGVRTDQSRFISVVDAATYRYVNRTAQLLLRRR